MIQWSLKERGQIEKTWALNQTWPKENIISHIYSLLWNTKYLWVRFLLFLVFPVSYEGIVWEKLNKYDAFKRRFFMKTPIENWLLLSVNLAKNKLVDHPFWQAKITCL